jgi:hypothetical protein
MGKYVLLNFDAASLDEIVSKCLLAEPSARSGLKRFVADAEEGAYDSQLDEAFLAGDLSVEIEVEGLGRFALACR